MKSNTEENNKVCSWENIAYTVLNNLDEYSDYSATNTISANASNLQNKLLVIAYFVTAEFLLLLIQYITQTNRNTLSLNHVRQNESDFSLSLKHSLRW